MDQKELCCAQRIVLTLLFVLAYVCIAPVEPQNRFRHVFKLPQALLHRIAYAQGPSQKIPLKIMPLGDSITFGTPDPSYGGYRHLLGALLTNDGYSFEFVGSEQSGNDVIPSPNNEGHPGWTILQVKNGIDSKGWLETYQPDIVLLHIGTNDLRPRVGGATSASDNLSALLDDILARLPQAHIIVAQIIPFRPGPDQVHESYNAAIPGIVASKAPLVSMVDMRNVLSPSDYADFLHPKAVGYDKMARTWERAIRAVIRSSAQRGETPAPRGASEVVTVPEVKPTEKAPALAAQPAPRRPRGIYAVINIEETIKKAQVTNPSITPAELKDYFVNLYRDLLGNPAVSGLALWAKWDALNPNPPDAANPYDWTYLDDAFDQASAWNARNPTKAPKTIQLVPCPGFQTPRWVLDRIPSCDGLFRSPIETPSRTCGKATFAGFAEGHGVRELPLPWNPLYKRSWRTFLSARASRFQSITACVSISVAGPTSSSEEMILPDNANTPAQDQFGGLRPNAMWLKLLAFHFPRMAAYQRSDQAFIDEWKAAIDMYGEIFSGVTLVATTGSGLPNLSDSGFTVPSAFTAGCPRPNMDCAAETTILSYFREPTVGGTNAKAAQEDGMEAARVSLGRFNLGVDGIKLVSESTAQFTAPSAQILGGAQFNSSFATFTLLEGCTSRFPPIPRDRPAGCSVPPSCTLQGCIPVECIPQACLAPGVTAADLASFKILRNVPAMDLISPEQSEYNVLRVFFDGTQAASFFGGTPGATPLDYLQIYWADFQYAEAHSHAPEQVVETGGASVSTSAQDLLNLASRKLLEIAEPALSRGTNSKPVLP
jgi:lysophospholipase L1-like esterase